MQLLEHEGKQLLRELGGVRVPRGHLAGTAAEAARMAPSLGAQVVVKAQVPTGGRGKGGGVRVVPSARAGDCAAAMLQSTVCGFTVHQVLVEEMVAADQEMFLAVALSPLTRSAVLLLSCDGGVDIEAAPDSVASIAVPPLTGLRDFHVRQVAQGAGVPSADVPALLLAAHAVYRLFTSAQAELVEVNPLLRTPTGELVAADVRVIPSTPAAPALPDGEGGTVSERAHALDFDVVEIDSAGHVGLLSTGAGASMLVVDLLAEAGARPVNFCDFRSGRAAGASQRLAVVLDYLHERPALRCLAVNFFAGVTDLVPFAHLLARTLDAHPLVVPVVVRLAGRGAEEARRELDAVGATVVLTLADLISESARLARAEDVRDGHR